MPTGVSLRRANPIDADNIVRWRAERSTARYQPILSLPIADIRAMLDERASLMVSPNAIGKFQWIIENDHRAVGWLTLTISEEDRRHDKAALGYTIGEEFRGNRFGTRGVGALLPIAFGPNQLNLARLEAVAAVENVASRRVLEKNGFQQEGILRGLLVINGVRVDHATFGLLKTEWEVSIGRNSDRHLHR
jgi:RimJ/RimL family protein N-acetyltransferase